MASELLYIKHMAIRNLFRLKSNKTGFTIVELLVVIVVIGILAAITTISYNGITKRAAEVAIASDLEGAAKQLNIYKVENGTYPTANTCPIVGTGTICLKTSSSNTLTYTTVTPYTFHLTITNGNSSYSVTDNSPIAVATTVYGSSIGSACPSGFIPVPGSGTYSTTDFCVMAYEARNSAGNKPISIPENLPWNINQNDAKNYSQNVAGCTGCHLIKETEWLTIAQNVLSVNSNWSGGSVGNGYIYRGNSDSITSSGPLSNDTDVMSPYSWDVLHYTGQPRYLWLTNGQEIWDLAGNANEWTQGVISSNVLPMLTDGPTGSRSMEWNYNNSHSNFSFGGLSTSSTPSYGNPTAANWNSTNGIGKLMITDRNYNYWDIC